MDIKNSFLLAGSQGPDADCSAHIVEGDNCAIISPPENKHTWQMGFWAPIRGLMHINEMLTCSSFSQEQAMKVKDEKRRKNCAVICD